MLDELSTPLASAFEVQVGERTVRLVPTNPVEIVGGGQAVALAAGFRRVLILCPPHLTKKWKREVEQTAPWPAPPSSPPSPTWNGCASPPAPAPCSP